MSAPRAGCTRTSQLHTATGSCVGRGVPSGLGEPVFDKLEAKLAHAMLSIPATKAFEIGSGFRGTQVPGSRHNDAFVRRADGSLGTRTNWSGGVQGGISNGEVLRVTGALKPISTVPRALRTVDVATGEEAKANHQRSDVCAVAPAAVIAEAMVALTLADALLEKAGGDSVAEIRRHLGLPQRLWNPRILRTTRWNNLDGNQTPGNKTYQYQA